VAEARERKAAASQAGARERPNASLEPLPACALCGARRPFVYHQQGYRRVLKCATCRFVFTDPLPSRERKAAIEREAYRGELLPEVADFFRNCHRDFVDDPVVRGFRDALDWIAEQAGATAGRGEGRRLLDVGPGTGIFLHLARERGWQPFGIDVCPESAEKAASEFDIAVDVGDFETFPYGPASFDAVTMLDVLEHMVDPLAALRRALVLLKPGGVLYVAVPNQRCLMTVILDRWIHARLPGSAFFLERLYVEPHLYYFCPPTLARMLTTAGFEMTGLRGGNVYLGRYRLPWTMRLPMEIVLQAGGLVGMSAKVHAVARRAG
jgi:2-polyprenyl-3-methyl-5-hydroxy-6-metoxy-1,4-benzoquinol methylase